MVVDLPAPFGPTKPVTWPGWTVNDMPSSASAGPNRLRSPLTSIVACIGPSFVIAAELFLHLVLRRRP